jgi:hypothetical protein
MAKMRKSTGEFFEAVHRALTHNDRWTLDLDECSEMPQLRSIGHPLNTIRAARALEFTACVSLGENHQMDLHGGDDANKTAGHLIHMCMQRIADLNGDPTKPDLDQLRTMLSDAYATFCTAYLLDMSERGLRRFMHSKASPFFAESTHSAA